MANGTRIAVVSPFLDKRNGTERCVTEQVERLARDYGYEMHVYSQGVEDLALDQAPRQGAGRITWRRVPKMPGPHLVNYLWWFLANHLWRWWDRRSCGLSYDLVFSPGINCLDADVIAVHIVFSEFYRRVAGELSLSRNPVHFWPRLLHRRLYYGLIMALERYVYRRHDVPLATISRKTTADLDRLFGRKDHLPIIRHGVDLERFNPEARNRLRGSARRSVGFLGDHFALLLIGNDWKKKGLAHLLEAIGRLQDPSLRIVIVGKDDPMPYRTWLERHHLQEQVQFLPTRPDVEYYYAAADAYVGPSLEDAFALPPLEAMACGLPVIVSSQAGVSEIVSDGVDGLILKDPTDHEELASLIRRLYENPDLRQRLAENATRTARQYTWDRNAAQMHAVFQAVIESKKKRMAV